MATWRTSETEVREIIGSDPALSLAPFIETANALTTWLSSKDTDGELNSDLLVAIEKNLAAHFYESRDPAYQEKKTGDASAVFQGKWGMKLDSSDWGQHAQILDVTGRLAGLNKGGRTSFAWLGKPVSEQTDYVDRD